MSLASASLDSPVGCLRVVASAEGLRAVLWPDERPGRVAAVGDTVTDPDHPQVARTLHQLTAYFAGELTTFDLPLDLRGTPFQHQAWLALAEIPYGRTTTYGRQAARLGDAKAVRAVASANARNPVSIVLPCHRVIGADGSLTGFGGGLAAKRWLLRHEGALPAEPEQLTLG